MKRFVKKLILLAAILIFIAAGIFFGGMLIVGPQYTYNYQASLIDKVARLKSINEPKIILVGNSNLAFGMDSEKLQKEIGMPVVNLGLHGDMGNAYHEEIAKQNINKGDIVIVCHSSYSDEDYMKHPKLVWVTNEYNFSLYSILRVKDIIPYIQGYPQYMKKAIKLWNTGTGNKKKTTSCYSRLAFNEYGDVVVKPEKNQMNVNKFFKSNHVRVPKINDICVNRLNRLNKYCNKRGATLLVAGYPIAYGEYSETTKEDFAEFKKELSEALDCEVISDFTDYFFPYDYFYNTKLHLTKEGAEARTDQLIADLKRWFENHSQQ